MSLKQRYNKTQVDRNSTSRVTNRLGDKIKEIQINPGQQQEKPIGLDLFESR